MDLRVRIYLALHDRHPPRDRYARGRRDPMIPRGGSASRSAGIRGLQT